MERHARILSACLLILKVGDIESMPFIEAMRQFQFRVGVENFCCLHVSLVPVVGSTAELKSKPTQASGNFLVKMQC